MCMPLTCNLVCQLRENSDIKWSVPVACTVGNAQTVEQTTALDSSRRECGVAQLVRLAYRHSDNDC
jgi:hypothetical protein